MVNRIMKRYVYRGFGFPIILNNIPAKKIRGKWIPFINYSELARSMLRFLCFLQEPLTGDQIFFVRQSIQLTGEKLADLLGVSQAAISKWEKKGGEIARIEPAIEICLRVIALEHLKNGSSDDLIKLFLENHLLGVLKEKQKNDTFAPSSIKWFGTELKAC